MKNKPLLKRTDFLIILGILIVAAIAYFWLAAVDNNEMVLCEIIYDGEVIREVDLAVDGTIVLDEFPKVVFEVRDGKVAFVQSDCPDHVCVRTGFISRASDVSVCLPNRLMLRLTGIAPSVDQLDAVAR